MYDLVTKCHCGETNREKAAEREGKAQRQKHSTVSSSLPDALKERRILNISFMH